MLDVNVMVLSPWLLLDELKVILLVLSGKDVAMPPSVDVL
jgi:hypothetical protein